MEIWIHTAFKKSRTRWREESVSADWELCNMQKQPVSFPKATAASSLKRFHTWGSEENATQAKKTNWGERRIRPPCPQPTPLLAQWSSTVNTKATVCQCAGEPNQLPQWQHSLQSASRRKHRPVNNTGTRLNGTWDESLDLKHNENKSLNLPWHQEKKTVERSFSSTKPVMVAWSRWASWRLQWWCKHWTLWNIY